MKTKLGLKFSRIQHFSGGAVTDKEDIPPLEPITATNAFYVKCDNWMEERKAGFIAKGVLPSPVHSVPFEALASPTSSWDAVEEEIRRYASGSMAENVIRLMRPFYESESDVLWVTVFDSKLWWCFSERQFVEMPDSNGINKTFRRIIGKWRDCDIKGKILLTSGMFPKMPSVKDLIERNRPWGAVDELDYLVNKINGTLKRGRKPSKKPKTI